MPVVNVVVADYFELFADGLVAALNKYHSKALTCRVVAITRQAHELAPLLATYDIHLLILDSHIPDVNNMHDFIQTIKTRHPNLAILLLCPYYDKSIIEQVLQAGANGFLLRHQGKAMLSEAVRTVLNGHAFLPDIAIAAHTLPYNSAWPVTEYAAPGSNSQEFIKTHSITKRELEILKLISQAFSNKQIAQTLFISVQTVSVHRKNIMRKIGVSNAAGLIKVAYDNSLV